MHLGTTPFETILTPRTNIDYRINLAFAHMPVVNVGNLEKPIYFPVDVCRVLPGQVSNGELGTIQRQNIISFSCRRPPDNYLSITRDGLKIMGIDRGMTEKMGIKVSQEMIAVPGRILNSPSIKYGRDSFTPRFGSWNLMNKKFCNGASCNNWAVLMVLQKGNGDDPTQSVNLLMRKSKEMGLMLSNPISRPFTVRYGPNFLEEMCSKFEEIKKNARLVLVLLPSGEEKIFSDIKYAGDVRVGILNHCCLSSKFIGGNDQYMANNAMKINLKLGGTCQGMDLPRSSRLLSTGKTMVVGLDVTHPTGTDPKEFPSIACIVASVDNALGQWPGQPRIQAPRTENIVFLDQMMRSCLERWQAKNGGQLPANILVYRDGVSEGQFDMVLREELPLIRKACHGLYRNPPAITVLVVGKRHNVRFFPTRMDDLDKTNNAINGTVVDRGVTRPIYWDFYLQAQAPLQGSARPAHYVVIHDEIFGNKNINTEGPPADVLQELTHTICYMMGRCTRSISYSTPAFLADRFCDRARRYVRAYFAHELEKPNSGDVHAPGQHVVGLHGSVANSMVYI